MFVPLWLIFLLSGTCMAVITIVWAVRSRQFEEQDRARYLPLHGLRAADFADEASSPKRGQGYYVTAALVFTGLFVLSLTLVSVLRHL